MGAASSSNLRPALVDIVGILAVVFDSFLPTKIAFALAGSLGLAVAAYVFPCVLFLKLDQERNFWKRASSLVIILFGCVLFFGSTPVSVWRAIHGDAGQASQPISELLCPKHLEGPPRAWMI